MNRNTNTALVQNRNHKPFTELDRDYESSVQPPLPPDRPIVNPSKDAAEASETSAAVAQTRSL